MISRNCLAVLLVSLSLGSAGFGQETQRPAIPTGEALKKAEALFQEVFGEDLTKARTAAQKSELAQKLLETATQSQNDPATFYVLLRETQHVAAAGSDLETALAALTALEENFADVPPTALRDTFALLLKSTKEPEPLQALARRAQAQCAEALRTGDFATARDLANIGKSAASAAKDLALLKTLTSTLADVTKAEAGAAALPAALEALAKTPDDPAANLTVGKQFCFVRNAWEKGLPHLAKSDHAGLKSAAVLELAGASQPAQQLAIADAWYRLADQTEEDGALPLRGHALDWYRQAQPHLKGLAKVRAERRLARAVVEDVPRPVAGASLAGPTLPPVFTNSLGIKLILLSPGEFLMGTPETENGHLPDETLHKVMLTKGFYLSMYEITQAEFLTVMGSVPQSYNAQHLAKAQEAGLDPGRLPVKHVIYPEAVEFCRRLSLKEGRLYRLPTEAEWEYACRAGTTTPYPYGTRVTHEDTVYDHREGATGGQTVVGSRKPNPWGFHDMTGNVVEWCLDWYGPYPSGPQTDPFGPPNGTERVIRGGHNGTQNNGRRSGDRSNHCGPEDRRFPIGMRLVLQLPTGRSRPIK